MLERQRKAKKQNRCQPIRELNLEAFAAPLNQLEPIEFLFQERCLDPDQFVSKGARLPDSVEALVVTQ
jgi:hypothetical protein